MPMLRGFLHQRWVAPAALLGVVAALAIPMAFADSPHFIGTPTCTKNADFSLSCSGKASGLGQHTGAAIAIQQGVTSTPTPLLQAAPTASATTPIETGVVNVQASVTLDVALVP